MGEGLASRIGKVVADTTVSELVRTVLVDCMNHLDVTDRQCRELSVKVTVGVITRMCFSLSCLAMRPASLLHD